MSITVPVYTLGYSGRTPEQIKQIAADLDAVVYDIRYKPSSRQPGFNGAALARTLGDRYVPARFFGNVNYRSGPIRLLDFAAGLEAVRQSEKPIILMCVCRDLLTCHRFVVGEMLIAQGFDVSEIELPSPPPKPNRQAELPL